MRRLSMLWFFSLLFIATLILTSCYFNSTTSMPDIPWLNNLEEIDRYPIKTDSIILYLESKNNHLGIGKVEQFQMVNQSARDDIVPARAKLDFIRYQNHGFYHQFPSEINFENFINYYSAFLIQGSRAIHFINVIDRNKTLLTVLDEANLKYGLEVNSFSSFKTHFLNPNKRD